MDRFQRYLGVAFQGEKPVGGSIKTAIGADSNQRRRYTAKKHVFTSSAHDGSVAGASSRKSAQCIVFLRPSHRGV